MGVVNRLNRSSFLVVPFVPLLIAPVPADAEPRRPEPLLLLPNMLKSLGFLPLSITFFRALMPTQSTSCFIASRSETLRRGAVRRIVLVRGSVPYGESA